MKTTGNKILITGGGSGIGRALAEAFYALGNKVIVAGRRRDVLEEVTRGKPGMFAATLDIASGADIAEFGARITGEHPDLNVVIHNAGIMRPEAIVKGGTADAEAMVATNLLGPIRLTAALLPTLLVQPEAAIMTVSSGLAFVPLAMTPTYCATKAAIHSYTQSLRYQLKGTKVQVLELAPPYVQTELMGEGQASDPRAMPLAEFISEVMSILREKPEATEVLVKRVEPLRHAEANGGYAEFFTKFNDAMAAPTEGAGH
jgi:uncharacterized oxidoreductase